MSVVVARLPTHVRQVAAEFRDRVGRRFGSRLLDVRVFGSCARGEAGGDSDLDLFALFAGRLTFRERRAVLDIAGDLWAETGLLVAPTVMEDAQYRRWRAEERPLAMAIDRDGIRP